MTEDTSKNPIFVPFCMRLAFEERARLEQEAGGQPLGPYIRSRLFERPLPRKRKKRKKASQSEKILAQILQAIGKSRSASNLNQLAKAHNSGSLQLDPETLKLLQDACKAEIRTRHAILRELGVFSRDQDDT